MNREWIYFEMVDPEPRRRTDRFRVLTKERDSLLGLVQWYTPWRRFAFFPVTGSVFEQDCLRTISDFCERATAARRAVRKKEREAERQKPLDR